MYKRLIIVSGILFLALLGLGVLGFHSISLHRQGLSAKRAAEFMEVAEQVRIDINRKLDTFIQIEQERPYTDYQYHYVPVASNDINALVRSPLAGSLKRGFAYGYFQIEPDGSVITPYYLPDAKEEIDSEVQEYTYLLENNLLSALNGSRRAVISMGVERISSVRDEAENQSGLFSRAGVRAEESIARPTDIYDSASLSYELENQPEQVTKAPKTKTGKAAVYKVNSLKESQRSRIERRSGANVQFNIDNTYQSTRTKRLSRTQTSSKAQRQSDEQKIEPMMQMMMRDARLAQDKMADEELAKQQIQETEQFEQKDDRQSPDDTVQIWKEPFVTFVIPDQDESKFFDGDVFLLRHVQIEQNHFLQGFKLDEAELLKQVRESAGRLIRRGMGFELSKLQNKKAVHVAVLDFDFGQLVLNLMERRPGWIGKQIAVLRNWYFAIVVIVFLAMILALGGLWKSAHAQLKLAQRKDDFISAVSHELRTPLTSIRMYTEMLEKDWVKTDAKRTEYYSTMRQESERLSRLIENVLDFSRIQKGQKKYTFKLGDMNNCVGEVVDMMAPYARQAGFALCKEFKKTGQVLFDRDAVMQIVINLIDNAVKYASDTDERIVYIRTKRDQKYVMLEVEDRGPGVPHLQRTKIFDEFYRIGDESVRETAGTGLGLALVKKFAEAHQGFVEILNANPKGAIFRVYLHVKA
jgi:signal transduction histidine kinase